MDLIFFFNNKNIYRHHQFIENYGLKMTREQEMEYYNNWGGYGNQNPDQRRGLDYYAMALNVGFLKISVIVI